METVVAEKAVKGEYEKNEIISRVLEQLKGLSVKEAIRLLYEAGEQLQRKMII